MKRDDFLDESGHEEFVGPFPSKRWPMRFCIYIRTYICDFDVGERLLSERPNLIQQHTIAVYITCC